MNTVRAVARLLSALAAEVILLRWMLDLTRQLEIDVGAALREHLGDQPIASTDPLDVAGALAARIGVVLIGYLVMITLAHVLGVLARSARPTRRIGNALTVIATGLGPRRLAAMAAVAAVVGTAGGCAPGAATPTATSADGSAPLHRRDQPATMTLEDTPDATMVLESEGPQTTSVPAPTPERTSAGQTAPAPTSAVVLRGDSLWSIAERTVTERLGRPAQDHETAPYWRILMEVNRHRLVDPGDPDLIHPGQELILP